MTIWRQWFDSLLEKEQSLIIERAWIANQETEPVGYAECFNYLISKRKGNIITTSRIYHEIKVPNFNEESCVHYFCTQLGGTYEKTYAHSSNGGNWNGWKIYLK